MVRVGIVTHGTDGDVLPFVFVARRLREKGHEVELCCPCSSVGLASQYGVEARGLSFDAKKVVACEKLQTAMRGGDGNECVAAFVQAIQDQMHRGADSAQEAYAFFSAWRPDLVLGHPSLISFATIAEMLGVPVLNVVFGPFLPSRSNYPAFRTWEQLEKEGLVGRQLEAHRRLWDGAVGARELHEINGLRRRWGLPPHASISEFQSTLQAIPTVNCWSASLAPPAADLAIEFPLASHAGQVLVDDLEGYEPPAALRAFLEAPDCERPVYVGFGSLSAGDPRGATEKVLRALILAGGKRCVMAGGWSGIGPEHLDPELTEGYAELASFAASSVFRVQSAPHGWLLPRCAAALHHGGAGTTAAAARAGVPMAIAPFAWDQPWWAERVEKLGVGIAVPAMITQVSADALADIIRRLTSDTELARRAAELASRLRGEPDGAEGVAEAVEAALLAPCPWPTAARPTPVPVAPVIWQRSDDNPDVAEAQVEAPRANGCELIAPPQQLLKDTPAGSAGLIVAGGGA